MAKSLTIEIGWNYIINGDIFKLTGISGEYFTLRPLKIKGAYHIGDDGLVVMKAIVFADAEIYGVEI